MGQLLRGIKPEAVRNHATAFFCASMAVAAYAPLVASQIVAMCNVLAYCLLPLIWAAALAAMVVRGREYLLPLDERTWPVKPVVAALLLLTVAVFTNVSHLAIASVLMLVASCAARCGGGELMWAVLPIWLGSWIMAVVPFPGDANVWRWAYDAAMGCSVATLDSIGVLILPRDGELLTRHGPSPLGPTVGQIVFLLATIGITTLYVVLRRRNLLDSLLVVLWSIVWAGAAEVLRIVVATMLVDRWQISMPAGLVQLLTIVALAGVVAWLIWHFDQLLALRPRLRRRKRLKSELPIPVPSDKAVLRAARGYVLTEHGELAPVAGSDARQLLRVQQGTLAIGAAFAVLLLLQMILPWVCPSSNAAALARPALAEVRQ
ncbi:MAG TPA: hypothetical protein VG713_07160 [Pirellulales bacterium]|nr:hypothetical protein [Pirellulales bacterium]